MKRLGPMLLATFVVSLIRPAAEAQDFGSSPEKSVRAVIQKSLSPEKSERIFAPRRDGELYSAKTADGWTLVAHRYRPRGPARPGALPVILCHGLSNNASFWALEPSSSLAAYLNGLGLAPLLAQQFLYQNIGSADKETAVNHFPFLVSETMNRRLGRDPALCRGKLGLDPAYHLGPIRRGIGK